MDPTPMQQTVMEPTTTPVVTLDPSSPQEVDPPAPPSPTTTSAAAAAATPTTNADQAYEPLSYDELFPALPNSIPASAPAPEVAASSWSKNSDMRIASSVITQVFRVPHEERAKIDGNSQFGESASSRICADITAKTGAHIEISSAKDQSLTFLVTGKNDAVLKARRLVLEKFQTQARQTVKVPKEHHRFILGKKGKKLQDLEVATATKIQVPSAADDSDEIIVFGTKDNIEKAMHEIRLISDEKSKQAYEKLEIPKQYHPFICGANNEKINALMQENNVRINVPPPSVAKNEITIAGEKDGVLNCKTIMTKVYKEMEKKCQTVSVEVRKSQHKYVVGSRGSHIAEILQETGVSIEMPSADSLSETISLRGPADKLGPALTMVYAKANSVVSADVEAPLWQHKFIIGRKGVNIRQITQDLTKVQVEFPDKQEVIKLEGPPEEVEVAKERLENMISDLQKKITFDEIPVNPRFYKHIIGKSGSNINRIRGETQVLINISEADGNNIIRLEGSPEGVAKAKQELLDLVAKMENEKERDIIIENRFHRYIIGTKGDKIREIREKFNQVLISFPDPGEKCDIVKIRGPKDDVDQCYKYLQKMVRELQESAYQIRVPIFKKFHKFIIGKGGANIKKIREETNTRIDLPSEGQNSDDIVITGKKENVEKAKEHIQKIQNELDNIVEVDIIIPSKFHNSMIGSGGKLIQSISEDCGGVAITFPPSESKSDKVTIRGPKEDVQKVKQILVDMSNEKQQASFTEEVRAKPQHHRFLIGRSGASIKKIRDATGARIIFPSDQDEDKELIVVIGKKESVAKAKELLEATIKELDKIVEDTMTVDPKHHRHFVARRGEVLRQIADQYGGVTVSFPRSGVQNDKVTLKGAKECVDAAKARILEIVDDLEQMVVLEVEIPQKYHRTVMGARGSKVQAITTEFDVQIKFPEKDSGQQQPPPVPVQEPTGEEQEQVNGEVPVPVIEKEAPRPQDIVKVMGKKDKCEGARDALLALVPITAELEVSFQHHRYIIGQKGDNVRAMMTEHDVNIQVPPAQDRSDIIRITGPPANVENAKEALLEKVAQLEEEELDRQAKSFKLTMEVDPEYHPKIIGKRGAVITKIREKHDVNIQFPQRDAVEKNKITIIGYEQNANAARDAILEITGELDNMTKEEVQIDYRIHSRLIGSRGRTIRKVMDDYKVEIKFPRGDDDKNTVIIMGAAENVEDAKEYLQNQAEEFMQDLIEQEELDTYMNPKPVHSETFPESAGVAKGFVVTGAPWAQQAPNMDSSEDFPSIGAPAAMQNTAAPAWGPRRQV
ncbi:satellite-binding protein 1 Dp1 [Oratosquilla oratoria]|uniref:satellite-binding protein 1 Dp1 n=1 Tax=Oratosquilla oratoria TaxID=337810 RepID=UPI003F76C3AE